MDCQYFHILWFSRHSRRTCSFVDNRQPGREYCLEEPRHWADLFLLRIWNAERQLEGHRWRIAARWLADQRSRHDSARQEPRVQPRRRVCLWGLQRCKRDLGRSQHRRAVWALESHTQTILVDCNITRTNVPYIFFNLCVIFDSFADVREWPARGHERYWRRQRSVQMRGGRATGSHHQVVRQRRGSPWVEHLLQVPTVICWISYVVFLLWVIWKVYGFFYCAWSTIASVCFGLQRTRVAGRFLTTRRPSPCVNVCKDCDRGPGIPGDLMVVGCNASNEHGFAVAQGYLNVLSEFLKSNLTTQCIVVVIVMCREDRFDEDAAELQDGGVGRGTVPVRVWGDRRRQHSRHNHVAPQRVPHRLQPTRVSAHTSPHPSQSVAAQYQYSYNIIATRASHMFSIIIFTLFRSVYSL